MDAAAVNFFTPNKSLLFVKKKKIIFYDYNVINNIIFNIRLIRINIIIIYKFLIIF